MPTPSSTPGPLVPAANDARHHQLSTRQQHSRRCAASEPVDGDQPRAAENAARSSSSDIVLQAADLASRAVGADELLSSPDTVANSPWYRAKTTHDRRAQTRWNRSGARPRPNAETRDLLRTRLTARDVWLLQMLAEHRVLTTDQVCALAFTNPHTARRRMLRLFDLGVTDRFQPFTHAGTAPLHHVLSSWGADYLVHLHDDPTASRHWRPSNQGRLAVSSTLAHRDGVADVVTALAAHARRHRDRAALTAWWSEYTCKIAWGGVIRPDSYARWATLNQTHTPTATKTSTAPVGPRSLARDHEADSPSLRASWTEGDFFLEYDTGSEDLARLVAKLNGYAALTAASGWVTPVLFVFHSARREAAAVSALRDWWRHPAVPAVHHVTGHDSAVPSTANSAVHQRVPGQEPALSAAAAAVGASAAEVKVLPVAVATTHVPLLRAVGPADRAWNDLASIALVATVPGLAQPLVIGPRTPINGPGADDRRALHEVLSEHSTSAKASAPDEPSPPRPGPVAGAGSGSAARADATHRLTGAEGATDAAATAAPHHVDLTRTALSAPSPVPPGRN